MWAYTLGDLLTAPGGICNDPLVKITYPYRYRPCYDSKAIKMLGADSIEPMFGFHNGNLIGAYGRCQNREAS